MYIDMFETFKQQAVHKFVQEFVTYFLHHWYVFLIWTAILESILNFSKCYFTLFKNKNNSISLT